MYMLSRKSKFALIIVIIGLLLSSYLLANKKSSLYAIKEATYPKKIGFDDTEEKRKRFEEISEDFLVNLKKFSINSASLTLSKADKNRNSLYSPISLYMALSMVAETAGGETQKEILHALNMDNIQIVRSETPKLFRRLYFDNQIGKLHLGNSLWLNKDIRFNSELLDLLANEYYASSYSLDFSSKESSKEISKWVSEHTGGKLGNENGEFKLSPDDVMTLINTVYFYDEWIDRFNIENTKEDNFYLDDGNIVKTDFMNMTYGSHWFVGVEGYTASLLNLKNSKSMIFILPDEGLSPYDIVSDKKLLDEAVNSIYSDKGQHGKVIFKIPKFKFSSSLNLIETSKALGIKKAFEDQADFTNLSDTKPLFISEIKQNSAISIDEKGVEAAAYTEIGYAGAAQPDGIAEMILDRPFIFVITGVEGSPLFIGIINNPNVE